MTPIHPMALFRLSVLGALTSRGELEHGELKRLVDEIATRPHDIPHSHRCYLSASTIEAWYYQWRRGGIEALNPKGRRDAGQSKIAPDLQETILQTKKDNPKRSLDELIRLLETQGVAAVNELKRSSVHRLLQQHGLSRIEGTSPVDEKRSFVAKHAGDIWHGDVMHGPKMVINGRLQRAYLVSLMDDASRLITHSAFCASETALAVEGVLKQALLKRGLPKKIILDNGAAYRAHSLQSICARLSIRLVYCKPYRPEGKGKIERWHRVVRAQLLSELTSGHLQSLGTLNAYLWAWIEQVYHRREHSALEGLSPLQRWQKDLEVVRPLGSYAVNIDAMFFHRYSRKVRKDGTVSFSGHRFEVPYVLSGQRILLVVDPAEQRIVTLESLQGEPLGLATPLDLIANNHRARHQPASSVPTHSEEAQTKNTKREKSTTRINALDQAYELYEQHHLLTEEED